MATKTLTCTNCGFTAKTAGGLTAHTRRHKTTMHVEPIQTTNTTNVCHNCHALPMGSVELVSLLLVLVFSLTAVLLTSVYAIDAQNHEIETLEAQLN